MAQQPQRISFDHFAGNLQDIFDRISAENRSVVVERDGETFRLEKEGTDDIWKDYDPEKARQALKHVAGILKGVDTQKLIAEIYAQREQDSEGRPA